MIDPSITDAGAVAGEFGADIEAGLTAKQASQRLRDNGPNELRSVLRVPAWRRMLRQFQDPLIYLLLAAITIALLAWAIDDTLRTRLLADVDSLSDAALRTLAVAYRPLAAAEHPQAAQATQALESELIFVGTVGIIDPPREEAAVAIREAQRAGIRVIMITGDHPRTAARIAQDLGIVVAGSSAASANSAAGSAAGSAALTGAEIDLLDEPGFADAVPHTRPSSPESRQRTSCASWTRCRQVATSWR